jgi:hypothetical protein
VVILASPKTLGHSPKVRLVVTMTELVLVEPADQVEEQLATSLGEGQVTELVQDDEVEAAEMIGGAAPGSTWGRLARASASSLLTRSTALKKRPRAPPGVPMRS